MNLERLPYDPYAVAGFFEKGLSALGALCDRTWHDRLEFVADGRSAELWGKSSGIHSGELHFVSADSASARDAASEVFPGCPLTFRLSESLRPRPLALERTVVAFGDPSSPPSDAVAEKLWRLQLPETRRWRLASTFKKSLHFSLLALTRCEVQAMDQHWSLHRVAVSLPDGALDEDLAGQLNYARPTVEGFDNADWPSPDPERWRALLQGAILEDLEGRLTEIRARQQRSLGRELERIDEYFEGYERELTARAARSRSESGGLKAADRIAVAKSEHLRRRADQSARHDIRILPHLDGLLLIAEPAWSVDVEVEVSRLTSFLACEFVPRARRWVRPAPAQ